MIDVLIATAPGDKDDRRLPQDRVLFQAAANLETADAGHVNVEGDEVKIAVAREFHSLSARLGCNHAASFPFEQEHHRVQHIRVVFNNQNLWLVCRCFVFHTTVLGEGELHCK